MPNPKSTAQIAGHPIHPMLIPFPIAGFVATFLADIGLASTGDVFWYRMGLWLLGGALVFAALAAVAGLVDVLCDIQIRNLNDAWLHAGGNVTAVLLELLNFYLRYFRRPELGFWHWPVAVPLHRADPALHRLERMGDGLQAPCRRL